MKLTRVTLLFVLSFASIALSQQKIYIQPGLGYFVYHSENYLDVSDDDNLGFTFNAGFGAAFSIREKHDLLIESEYISSFAAKVLESEFVDEHGIEDGTTYFELSQNTLSFDISMLIPLTSHLEYGIGPSFGVLNRTLEQKRSIDGFKLTDALYSFGVGAILYLQHSIRFNKNSKLFLQTKIKSRYLYSIWFDSRNRDLDNYSLHYLNIAGYIGLGYKF